MGKNVLKKGLLQVLRRKRRRDNFLASGAVSERVQEFLHKTNSTARNQGWGDTVNAEGLKTLRTRYGQNFGNGTSSVALGGVGDSSDRGQGGGFTSVSRGTKVGKKNHKSQKPVPDKKSILWGRGGRGGRTTATERENTQTLFKSSNGLE